MAYENDLAEINKKYLSNLPQSLSDKIKKTQEEIKASPYNKVSANNISSPEVIRESVEEISSYNQKLASIALSKTNINPSVVTERSYMEYDGNTKKPFKSVDPNQRNIIEKDIDTNKITTIAPTQARFSNNVRVESTYSQKETDASSLIPVISSTPSEREQNIGDISISPANNSKQLFQQENEENNLDIPEQISDGLKLEEVSAEDNIKSPTGNNSMSNNVPIIKNTPSDIKVDKDLVENNFEINKVDQANLTSLRNNGVKLEDAIDYMSNKKVSFGQIDSSVSLTKSLGELTVNTKIEEGDKVSISNFLKEAKQGDTKRLEILAYNLLPYMATKEAGNLRGLVDSLDFSKSTKSATNLAKQLEKATTAIIAERNTMDRYAMLDPDEIAKVLSADFYTVMSGLTKGIKIKEDISPNTIAASIERKIIPRAGMFKSIGSDISSANFYKNIDEKARDKMTRMSNTIGYILVIPFEKDLRARIKIPFQTTPLISPDTATANYTNEMLLHRTNELYSYISSKKESYTLNTSYTALARDIDNQSHYGGLTKSTEEINENYLSVWTTTFLQGIKLAYSSLTLPTYPTDKSTNFTKPPFIKIVIGEQSQTSGIKNMMLRNYGTDNKLKSFGDNKDWKSLKTFVVSSITIDKKMNEGAFIFDKNGNVLDTMGFEVSMNLLEVTPSYMDIEPDYNDVIKEALELSPGIKYDGRKETKITPSPVAL